jgi:hypothetical protein
MSSGLNGDKPDSKALAQLIEKSQSIGDRNLEGAVYIMYTMAQRANIKGKLKVSLEYVSFHSPPSEANFTTQGGNESYIIVLLQLQRVSH